LTCFFKCATLVQMKSSKQHYLINCGEGYALEKAKNAWEAGQIAINKMFDKKNLNISISTLILEVDKCFSDFDMSSHTHIFSTSKILRSLGKADLGASLEALYTSLNINENDNGQ